MFYCGILEADKKTSQMKQKTIITVVILVLAVVATTVVYLNNQKAKKNANSKPGVKQTKSFQPLPVTDVTPSKLPDRFPTDIPLEQGAQIIYNFNGTNAAGMYQSTRQFESQKTIDQNYTLYQDALKKSGYTITQVIEDMAHFQKIIFATKGDNSVAIRSFALSGQIRVDITNTTKP